jgi:hypothetical protein
MSEQVKKIKEEEKNPIERLFDENDTSPISLYNEKGEAVKFDQIAIIPVEEQIFAILKPVDPMEGLNDDEALVFEIVEPEDEDEEDYLNLVSDIDLIDKVFEAYNKLMDEEEEKQKIGKGNKGNK